MTKVVWLVAAALILAGCTREGWGKPDLDGCRFSCPPGSRAMATQSDGFVWKCGCVEAPEVKLTCLCGDKPEMRVE